MNAYELADKLDDDVDCGWCYNAADMLRQQADQIKDLEKEKKCITVPCDKCGCDPTTPQTKPLTNDTIWAYAHIHQIKGNVIDFVRDLEKHTDDKFDELKRRLERAEDLMKKDGWNKGQPDEWGYHTYWRKPTPQTKPLSDEEIKKIWIANSEKDGILTFNRFARAIEKWHGIK